MNVTFISPAAALAALDISQAERMAAYRDPVWLGEYQGQNLYRLSNGLYYSANGGCAETLNEAKTEIDRWVAMQDAPGFEAGYFLP